MSAAVRQQNKGKTGKKDISLIIPVFREQNRIDRCIKESLHYFSHNPFVGKFELIFVADVSGDATISIIKQYAKKDKRIRLIVGKTRLEKGFSVREGMKEAKYDVRLFYDADLSTPLTETEEFLKLIDGYDILIASRGLKESKVEKTLFKIFLSRSFSILKYVVLGINFKDTQCGFKMFTRKALPIFDKQTIKSSCFDVELLYIAQLRGLRIREIPVTWIDSDMTNFSMARVIPRFLKDIFRIRINHSQGEYK